MTIRVFSFLGVLICSLLFSCSKKTTGSTSVPPVATPQFELSWTEDFNTAKMDTNTWYHTRPGIRHDGFNDSTTVSTDGSGNLVIQVYSDTLAGIVKHRAGNIATKKE